MKVGVREKNSDLKKKPTRYFSKDQESSVAEILNGTRNLNSGATPFIKGDVSLTNCLIECKTKTSHSNSITVKKEWILKNKKEALFMGKSYNAVCINFGPNEENYYIIDEYLFKELIEKLNK